MTMSENVNIVKERLDMIMNYKKKSKLAACGTFLLSALLLCGFTFAGAVSGHAYQKEGSEAAAPAGMLPYTMDGTTILRLSTHEVTANDKDMTKNNIAQEIQQWIGECDKETGAYLFRQNTATGYTYYLYYNGGGRYPWGIGADGASIYINLLANNDALTGDGYTLIKIDTPVEQTFFVTLDGASLPIITQKDKPPVSDKTTVYEMQNGKVTIPFTIDSISSEYICLGQVPNINNAKRIVYTAEAEGDTGLFIAMSAAYMNADIQSRLWRYYVSGNGKIDKTWENTKKNGIGAEDGHTGDYFLYVGLTRTAQTNIKGIVTIEY